MYSKKFYNKDLKLAARELRKNMTPAEYKLWYGFLRSFLPRARRQRAMGNFIVDFYIPKTKLVIEIDGEVHDNEKSEAKDDDRTIFLNKFGIHVIRFRNQDVLGRFESVCETIIKEVSSRK